MCLIASKYMRQKLIGMQGEIDEFTIIAVDLNTLLSNVDRFSQKKISKHVVELNNTIDQLNRIDIYRLFHPTTNYAFFSSSYGAFTQIYHIWGQKPTVTSIKTRYQTMSAFGPQGIKQETKIKKTAGKF